MADIDQLNIKIEADAQRAHSSVDTLINKLGRLNSALGGINTSNLTSLSNGIQKLSNSMQSMKNIGTADFTRLAKNIQKMGSLDANSLSKAAGSIHRFANSLGNLDKISVSDNATQIGELAKGISRLGYKSSTQAIENIPKLAKAMRQLMTELSKAPRVSQNLIQMTNALANLSRTGAASGRAANSLSKSLNTYTASTHKASKGSFSLASAIGKIYATYWMLFRAVGVLKKSIDISSQLTEVQNVVDTTFGDMSYKVEEFAKTSIQQFGMSELSLKQYASRFQAMGSAMGISSSSIGNANSFLNKQTKGYVGLSNSMADVSLNLTKLTADMASFYNVEQAVVAEDLEAIFTGQTRPLRQYGLDLTQATLQEWALKNGIDANVASMSQAEKTMLRYQYVLANTGAAQGDFAKTANTWANQIRILKQNFEQLGSIVGRTLINALKPLVQALNVVMGKFIAFAETVSNALGKIFGWKYESASGGAGLADDMEDAAGSADDIADSTGTAADNIKKMQAGLRAFDELKTINLPDNSSNNGSGSGSGSGGSGGSSGASGSGGQWVRQESMFEDYQSSIDSLYGLGDYIGTTLTNALNSIPWDDVYATARNFGTGLANFLNGLISPELFGALGTTISNSLNTALHFLDSFGNTFDFENFGTSVRTGIENALTGIDWNLAQSAFETFGSGIAEALNALFEGEQGETILGTVGSTVAEALNTVISGALAFADDFDFEQFGINLSDAVNQFFDTFDFDLLADNINTWAHGILDVCISFVSTTDWEQIGTKVGEFLVKIDFTGIASKVGKLLWKAINAAIVTWKSMFDAAPVETTILTAIGLLKFTGLGTLLLGKLKNAIVVALGAEKGTSIGMALLGWIGRGISSIATKIGLVIEGLFSGMKFSETLASVFGGSASAISALITTISGVVSVVGGAITAIASFISMLTNGFSWVKEAIMGVGIAITAVGAVILGAPAAVAAIVAGIVAAVATLVVVVKDNWETIKGWFSGAGTWFNTKVVKPVCNFFKGLWTSVAGFFSNLWTDITNVWTTVSAWFNNYVITPISTIFSGVCTRIGQFFDGCWLIVQATWIVVSTWFKDNVINPIKTKFGEVKTKIESVFSSAKQFVVDKWNGIKGWFETNVTGPLKTKFGEVKTKISTAFSDAKKAVTNVWNGISTWFNNTVINPVRNAFKTACDKIGGFFNSLWKGVKKGVASAFNVVISNIESAINGIVSGINKMLSGFNAVAKKAGEIVGKDYSGVAQIPKVSLPRIKGYEAGGFPQRYSLFMAGENGIPEIAGTVGGKTAVAGGAEITGIRDAIYTSSQQEMRLLQEQNQLLRGILNKQFGITQNDIGRAAQGYAREQFDMTGESVFVF